MDEYTQPQHDRSALIVVDMQRDFLDGGPLEVPGASAIVPRIVRALAAFRRAGRPVVHVVRLYTAEAGSVDLCRRGAVVSGSQMLAPGSEGSQLAPEHLPEPGVLLDTDVLLAGGLQTLGPQEWIVYKPRWGAFYGTPLEDHLRSIGVSTLVFSGCNFPNCPRTSIYEASERDFRVVALADALAGIYPRGIEELEGIGCCVVDTDAYLSGASQRADAEGPA